MSKGSRQRPVDRDKFNENYERIFGKRDRNDGKTKQVHTGTDRKGQRLS